MVFQYYPGVDHAAYRTARAGEILRKTHWRPLWITDNQVIFFFMARPGTVRAGITHLLGEYASRYSGLVVGT